MSRKKLRFDLFTLIELTAALAIASALLAGAREVRSVTWRFSSLPVDDAALAKWLLENGQADVSVERHSKTVTMRKQSRSVLGSSMNLPRPPWEDLGYASAEVDGGSSGWTVLGGSAYPWLVGLGLLVALRCVRTRLATGPSRATTAP